MSGPSGESDSVVRHPEANDRGIRERSHTDRDACRERRVGRSLHGDVAGKPCAVDLKLAIVRRLRVGEECDVGVLDEQRADRGLTRFLAGRSMHDARHGCRRADQLHVVRAESAVDVDRLAAQAANEVDRHGIIAAAEQHAHARASDVADRHADFVRTDEHTLRRRDPHLMSGIANDERIQGRDEINCQVVDRATGDDIFDQQVPRSVARDQHVGDERRSCGRQLGSPTGGIEAPIGGIDARQRSTAAVRSGRPRRDVVEHDAVFENVRHERRLFGGW